MQCPFTVIWSRETGSLCRKCANNLLNRHRNDCVRIMCTRKTCYKRGIRTRVSLSDLRTTKRTGSVTNTGESVGSYGDRTRHSVCSSLLSGRCIRSRGLDSMTVYWNQAFIDQTHFTSALNTCVRLKNPLLLNQQKCLLKNKFHTSASRFGDEVDKDNSTPEDLENDKHSVSDVVSVNIGHELHEHFLEPGGENDPINEFSVKTSYENISRKNSSEEISEDATSRERDYGSEAVLDNEHNAVFDESSLKRTGEHESTDGSQNKHRKHSSDKTQLKEHDSSSSQAAVNKTDSEKETAVELPNSLIADHKTNDQASMKEVFPQFGGVGEIKDFLKGHSMETVQGHTCYVTSCPKLGKMVMKKKHKSEGERLFINITSGHFLCEHCKKRGSWLLLKDNVTALKTMKKKKDYVCFENIEVEEEMTETPPEIVAMLETGQYIKQLQMGQLERLLQLFDWQGITQSTLEKCGAKCTIDGDTYILLLPVKSFRGVIVGVRKFVVKYSQEEEEPHTSMRVTSHPRQLSEPFGWQSVKPKSTAIVITGSEAESLAITQQTDIPSVALKKLSFFPQELLPYLESFKKIILWIGNDVKAWQSSKQFAKKLNDLRCHVFRPNPDLQSPLEAIRSEMPLKNLLLKARPIGHDSIVSFSNLRHEVYTELAQIDQVAGVKWTRHTPLNKILKGHRPGELTVLTGPTGSGKTTFVSDYSLDLCMQGVNTLWGSFEISNVRLAKVMLTQFAGRNMTKNIREFDEVADQFAEVPMFFMTYFGQEEVEKVTEAMSHAVYVHDIRHIIVDNLQFMMGMNYSEGSRFHQQDKIISIFRKFATKMNCHVTLIIHPRKEKDGEELMMASIFGSAKAVQEADNVFILQDMRLTAASGRKYIQIMKNRFDGQLGVMMLKFDKESLRFVPTQKKSLSQKTNEKEEEEEGQELDISVGSRKTKKTSVTRDRKKASETSDLNEAVKFVKLGETGHDFETVLNIDKYYS